LRHLLRFAKKQIFCQNEFVDKMAGEGEGGKIADCGCGLRIRVQEYAGRMKEYAGQAEEGCRKIQEGGRKDTGECRSGG